MTSTLGRLRTVPGAVARLAEGERRRRMDLLRSGARQMLEQIEWDVERVLHVGRLILWTGLSALLIFVLQF